MAKMSMTEEVKFLRQEVDRLKKEEEERVHEAVESVENNETFDNLVDGAHNIENELEEKVHDLVETMKDDYESMSPVTAVAIFAVGAIFGRIFLSK